MRVLSGLIRAAVAVLIVGGTCLRGVLIAALGLGSERLHRLKSAAGRAVLWTCGARVTVEGIEHVPREGGFILFSNHESHLDGPLIVGWFPRDFTIVAKKELFRIPILGAGFRAFGFVKVDRANHAQSVAKMDAATAHLHGGGGMLIFPEGHRTETGEFQAFKRGGFVMALKAGVPLIPAGIGGTREALPSGGLSIRPGPVCLLIGPPILVAGRDMADREALTDECRAIVADLRTRAKAKLTEAPAAVT